MELPVRILRAAPEAPIVLVDGDLEGARGLHLSHWPGNRTPPPFRHDLSTGSALAFARLEDDERRRWSAGCELLANSHYDTDGVCALFATRSPALALPRAERLLAAASAGDFFRAPDRDALALDLLVAALADPARSPLALLGLDDVARWELAQAHLLEHLPALLDGALGDYRPLWEPDVRAVEADRRDLDAAERSEHPDAELTVWRADGRASTRDDAPAHFDPGRHALFGASPRDRVLAVSSDADGTRARLVVSTRSWFDLVSVAPPPRPDLAAVAARLNAREGCAGDEARWRADEPDHASPELWFGVERSEPFPEHAPALRPSRTSPEHLLAELLRCLRRASREPSV